MHTGGIHEDHEEPQEITLLRPFVDRKVRSRLVKRSIVRIRRMRRNHAIGLLGRCAAAPQIALQQRL
jgi:hypothetical protein